MHSVGRLSQKQGPQEKLLTQRRQSCSMQKSRKSFMENETSGRLICVPSKESLDNGNHDYNHISVKTIKGVK